MVGNCNTVGDKNQDAESNVINQNSFTICGSILGDSDIRLSNNCLCCQWQELKTFNWS